MDQPAIQYPQNREAEEAVIGSVLINSEIFHEIEITAEDFYLGRHKLIWAALVQLIRTGAPVDFVTLTELLDNQGHLAEIGGAAYLTRLVNSSPSSLNAPHYAAMVREKARRRRALQIANQLAKGAFDEGSDLDDLIGQVTTDLVSQANTEGGARHISEFISDLYSEVEERAKDPRDIYGIATGIPDFDEMTHGFQPGEMFLLSGDPGLGKSILAGQFAAGMSGNGAPGACYWLEMRTLAVVRRLVSGQSRIESHGITTQKMRSGRMQEDDWPVFTHLVEGLAGLPVYMSDRTNWTTVGVRADLARLKRLYGIQWFVVDYLDLLVDLAGKDEVERSTYISHQLKAICKDLNLAGLIIQSENKEGISNQSKRKTSMSGSAKLLHDADQIAFLEKHPDYPLSMVRLKWDKVREDDPNIFVDLVKPYGYPVFIPEAHKADSEGGA